MNLIARKMIRQLTADKRKLSLVIGLLAVGMLLWGRILLKKLPKNAVADPSQATTAKVDPVDTKRGETGVDERETVFVEMSTNLNRDVFALNSLYFPIDKPTEPKVLMKDEEDDADNPKALETAVRDKSKQLQLQTTILGERPKALINGQLVEPGDHIKGFRVKAVGRRTVVLEMNGIEIELEM